MIQEPNFYKDEEEENFVEGEVVARKWEQAIMDRKTKQDSEDQEEMDWDVQLSWSEWWMNETLDEIRKKNQERKAKEKYRWLKRIIKWGEVSLSYIKPGSRLYPKAR